MAWGPVGPREAEVAVVLVGVIVVPPFVVAVLGSFVHAFAIARRDGKVALLPLFLRWWMWCTLGWVGAWLLAWLG